MRKLPGGLLKEGGEFWGADITLAEAGAGAVFDGGFLGVRVIGNEKEFGEGALAVDVGDEVDAGVGVEAGFEDAVDQEDGLGGLSGNGGEFAGEGGAVVGGADGRLGKGFLNGHAEVGGVRAAVADEDDEGGGGGGHHKSIEGLAKDWQQTQHGLAGICAAE